MIAYLGWFVLFLLAGFTTMHISGESASSIKGHNVKKKSATCLLVLFFLCGTIMIGLRDGGGVDDSQYRLFYEMGYGLNSINSFLTQKEPFYVLIRQIGVACGLNYKFMFLVYATASMAFICCGIKKFNLGKSFTAVYIFGFFVIAYTTLFTTMRQTLAIAILFYYYSLEKPTIKQKIGLFVLAFCAHYSSIVVLLIEIFRIKIERRIDKIWKIIIPIICLVCGTIIDFQSLLSKITSLIGMYDYMNWDDNFLSNSNVGIFTFLLFAGYIVKVWNLKQQEGCSLKIESLQLIYFSLAFLTSHLRWGNRIQLFYIMFVPFVLIEDLECISQESRKYITLALTLFLIPCSLYVISQNPDILYAIRSLNFR